MPFRTKKIHVDLASSHVAQKDVFAERKVEAQLNTMRSQQVLGSSSKKTTLQSG